MIFPHVYVYNAGTPIIVFRPDVALSHENDETYTGSLTNFDELKVWIQEKCVPLVREITFESAEELTEEGLPFLILFYRPDDLNAIKDYKAIIEQQLLDEKRKLSIFCIYIYFLNIYLNQLLLNFPFSAPCRERELLDRGWKAVCASAASLGQVRGRSSSYCH